MRKPYNLMIKVIKISHQIKEEEKYLKFQIMLTVTIINSKMNKKKKTKNLKKMAITKIINREGQPTERGLF